MSERLASEDTVLLNESGQDNKTLSDYMLEATFPVLNEKPKVGSCLFNIQFLVMKFLTFSI